MDPLSPATLDAIGKIGTLGSSSILLLVLFGFLRGWIWPGPAVQDILKQRDALMTELSKIANARRESP